MARAGRDAGKDSSSAMTLTRIPTREELVCLVCHKPGVALDHIRERSLAPELKDEPWNIAPLCPACHDLKHQKRILTKVRAASYWWKQRGAGHPWIRVDVHINKRHKCLEAGSAAAEAREVLPKVPPGRQEPLGSAEVPEPLEARSGGHTSAAAPPASGGVGEGCELDISPDAGVDPASPHSESSAAEPLDEGAHPSPARDSSLVPSPSAAPPSFNKDAWCREGMQLVYWYIAVRDATDEVRFKIGDWYNEGDRVLGEEAPGYLRGFEDVTVRQYSWVAGRVSPDTRVSTLAWTYHRAVAALEAPKQKEWLEKAQEENLSSKGLYRAIHGEKPKVRRWTLEELRQERYGTEKQRIIILAFLDWLGAK